LVVVLAVGPEAVWEWFGLQGAWDLLTEAPNALRPPAAAAVPGLDAADPLQAVDWCQGCDQNTPRAFMRWDAGRYRCIICTYGGPEMVTQVQQLREIAHG
jgi:hypothetical protein